MWTGASRTGSCATGKTSEPCSAWKSAFTDLPSSYKRLSEIKQQYDPNQVFKFEQSIEPYVCLVIIDMDCLTHPPLQC